MSAYAAIPAELRELPRWVVWRWEPDRERPEKRRKPPYCSGDLRRHASSTEPETWGTFERALAAVESGDADGVGFALGPPYVGVDLDAELPETKQYGIILALDSYAERSASGRGHHVILRASLAGDGRHPRGIGVFQTGRFFYCTGEHVPTTPRVIERRQEQLERVLAEYLAPSPRVAPTPVEPVDLDDHELIEKAKQAKNGALFTALWEGDVSGYGDDDSRADLALCDLLAFWTRRDPERIDRLFRASGLMRGKWMRKDYRNRTIEKAIAGRREVYKSGVEGQNSHNSAPAFEGSAGERERERSPESSLRDSGLSNPAPHTSRDDSKAELNPDSAPDSGRPFSMPIREFVSHERERREPLIADADGRAVVGRRSLVMLGGLGGSGKTSLADDVFLHLAAGEDFGPWVVPEPVSILIVENEGPEDLYAEKLKRRLDAFPHELKGRLDVFTAEWGGFDLRDERLRERLTNEIAEKHYDLVFGDPLDLLGMEGVGSPSETREFLRLMKETGLNKTVAWWLNTHPRKEETREALNEIAGAWGGKPDTIWLLKMFEGDRSQLRQPKLRWAKRGKGPTLMWAFDPETESFAYLGEEAEIKRDRLPEIRALLADGRWRTVKEISAPKKPKKEDEEPGIGADSKLVKEDLEKHPDVFRMRTGDLAVSLGYRPDAKLWGLVLEAEADEADEQLEIP